MARCGLVWSRARAEWESDNDARWTYAMRHDTEGRSRGYVRTYVRMYVRVQYVLYVSHGPVCEKYEK